MAEGRADADVYTETAARIMALYRQRIEDSAATPEALEISHGAKRIELQLRLAGVRAERDAVFRLSRERVLDEEAAKKLVRELDLLEARYSG
jgi:CPA1 family monovalent cation:H+ antiporter